MDDPSCQIDQEILITDVATPAGKEYRVSTIDTRLVENPIGLIADAILTDLFGLDNLPFEVLVGEIDGRWLNISRANYDSKEAALAQHQHYVDLIRMGNVAGCVGENGRKMAVLDKDDPFDANYKGDELPN